MITAAVERGAPTGPIHRSWKLLDPVVADALSHPFSVRPFASLTLPLTELLQKSALPVFMCWWPTVAARVDEAQQLMGATRVRAPGVLIPLRGFELFSVIVGNMQVRSSSTSRRSPCASPLLLPFLTRLLTSRANS